MALHVTLCFVTFTMKSCGPWSNWNWISNFAMQGRWPTTESQLPKDGSNDHYPPIIVILLEQWNVVLLLHLGYFSHLFNPEACPLLSFISTLWASRGHVSTYFSCTQLRKRWFLRENRKMKTFYESLEHSQGSCCDFRIYFKAFNQHRSAHPSLK